MSSATDRSGVARAGRDLGAGGLGDDELATRSIMSSRRSAETRISAAGHARPFGAEGGAAGAARGAPGGLGR
jgi:hypothetical protein